MSKNEAWEQMGEQLREYRKQKGLSTHKAARLIGISGNYISQIERGLKAPSVAIILSLAEFYQINPQTMYDVYGREEHKYAKDIKKLPASARRTINHMSKDESLTEENILEAMDIMQKMLDDMREEQ